MTIKARTGRTCFGVQRARFRAETPVAAWYEEIDEHNFSAPKLGDQAGHFTQAAAWPRAVAATFGSAAIHRPAMLAGGMLAMYRNPAREPRTASYLTRMRRPPKSTQLS
jgi:hypothetical protein